MSKEAMKLALEALEANVIGTSGRMPKTHEAITALREALAEQPAQPQQEPVAVVSGYYGGQCVILPIDPARIFNSNTTLYTTPPPCPTCEALARTVMLDQTSHDTQRQSRSDVKPLTDEEIGNLLPDDDTPMSLGEAFVKFARAAEAKLKEKNT